MRPLTGCRCSRSRNCINLTNESNITLGRQPVNRTFDGQLRLCLLCDEEGDVRTLLRYDASDAELEQLLRNLIWRKPWGHGLPDGVIPLERGMSQIGG
jgi:hypothetical protein